jgi:hypothetical protein
MKISSDEKRNKGILMLYRNFINYRHKSSAKYHYMVFFLYTKCQPPNKRPSPILTSPMDSRDEAAPVETAILLVAVAAPEVREADPVAVDEPSHISTRK